MKLGLLNCLFFSWGVFCECLVIDVFFYLKKIWGIEIGIFLLWNIIFKLELLNSKFLYFVIKKIVMNEFKVIFMCFKICCYISIWLWVLKWKVGFGFDIWWE